MCTRVCACVFARARAFNNSFNSTPLLYRNITTGNTSFNYKHSFVILKTLIDGERNNY